MGRHSDPGEGSSTRGRLGLARALVGLLRASGTAELAGWGLFVVPLSLVVMLLSGQGWRHALLAAGLVALLFTVLLVAGLGRPHQSDDSTDTWP